MKEYVLIFRTSPMKDFVPTEEQAQQMNNSWMGWMHDIEKSGKMANGGSRLGISDSRVVQWDVVTNGPYTEVKEFINGFIIVKTVSVDEAVEVAKGCPLITSGSGSVEVRPSVMPDDNS